MELKQALQSGGGAMGIMITMVAQPDIVRVLSLAGYDFAMVDCEHGSFTTREVANLIGIAMGIDFPVLVRIPEMRREHALKYMEMGAAGLMLPQTEDADQARALVDCIKYAPEGHRGVSLARPHTRYQPVSDGRAYMQGANARSIVLCQIESRLGVQRAAEIAAVPGVDVLLIGPNDMSQDYGLLNQYDHPEVQGAFSAVIAAAKASGKAAGAHFTSPAQLVRWMPRGMRFNMCGTDVSLLRTGAKADWAALRG
jgi:2-dehydro-3-deoxyglucarate aldolase/4-hydroxy-2-oxoheptanedioate aldolase